MAVEYSKKKINIRRCHVREWHVKMVKLLAEKKNVSQSSIIQEALIGFIKRRVG